MNECGKVMAVSGWHGAFLQAGQWIRLALLGVLMLTALPAWSGVTALTAGNTPQNVQLGQAMTATTITPTGTPYVAQWLGQAYTWEGPSNSGSLAPDHVYSFTEPKDIAQLPNGNYYVLDGGNIRAIDRSTGGGYDDYLANSAGWDMERRFRYWSGR